jgi:hypothetical protein
MSTIRTAMLPLLEARKRYVSAEVKPGLGGGRGKFMVKLKTAEGKTEYSHHKTKKDAAKWREIYLQMPAVEKE